MKKKIFVLFIGIMSLCSTTGTNLEKEKAPEAPCQTQTQSIYTLNPLFIINY